MFLFRELYELWRKDNSLTRALNESNVMMASTYEMFRESVKSLRESDSGQLDFDIYEKDQMVNKYEQKVRRRVLKHLAITGGANIIPGLILTSIVIDIERIGDYTKNIMELAVDHPRRLQCGAFEDAIKKIEAAVVDVFERILPIMQESDKDSAREVINENYWLVKNCDEIVRSLVKAEDTSLGLRDAVATAMYARYLKRIAAHIFNVATGIVNPFEKIGFREEEED